LSMYCGRRSEQEPNCKSEQRAYCSHATAAKDAVRVFSSALKPPAGTQFGEQFLRTTLGLIRKTPVLVPYSSTMVSTNLLIVGKSGILGLRTKPSQPVSTIILPSKSYKAVLCALQKAETMLPRPDQTSSGEDWGLYL